jgi:serine/threonine protein kinase
MNKFNIIKELYDGIYSKVFLVKNGDQEYAMKKTYKIVEGCNLTKNIYKEISILKELKHPNIISIIDWFEDDEFVYMIFEYIKDGDLTNRNLKREEIKLI